MEIFAFLLAIVVLFFLGRVGFLIHEVMSMDFDFNRPWPDELPQADQVEQQKVDKLTEEQYKTELEGWQSILTS